MNQYNAEDVILKQLIEDSKLENLDYKTILEALDRPMRIVADGDSVSFTALDVHEQTF